MRSDRQLDPAFVVGLAVGATFVGVTFVLAGAVRRTRSRRRRLVSSGFIDGVHALNEVELHLRPAEEGNSREQPPRLESEMPEFSPMSQRW